MKRKLLFLGSSILVLLLAGNVSAQTQTQELPPDQTTQEAPQTEVSPEELQQFASAMQQLQSLQQSYEEQMAQAVQTEGLSKERFIEIRQLQSNPEAEATSEVSPEELQSFESATSKLTEIQQQAMTEMKAAIESQGLQVQRFNQIMAAVQQDPNLQQEIQQQMAE